MEDPMNHPRRLQGQPRDARGHHHVGGTLGLDKRERHYTAAVVAIVASIIVAGAASAYASYASSEAPADAADYQRKVARNQAQAARDAAAAAAEDQADEDARIMALQRARIGESGIDPTVGNPLLVQSDAAATAELNRRRILWQGETGARNYESDAILAGWESKTARRLGYLQVGTTLLSTAAKAYAAGAGGGAGSTGRTEGAWQTQRAGERRGYA
jgi:hypothetical protein